MISKLQLHINPIQDRPFWGILKMGGGGGGKKVPLPKICHTCLTKMAQLYFAYRRPKKYMNIYLDYINYIDWILEQNF